MVGGSLLRRRSVLFMIFAFSLSNVMDIIYVASAHDMNQLILNSGFSLRRKTQLTDANVGQKFVWAVLVHLLLHSHPLQVLEAVNNNSSDFKCLRRERRNRQTKKKKKRNSILGEFMSFAWRLNATAHLHRIHRRLYERGSDRNCLFANSCHVRQNRYYCCDCLAHQIRNYIYHFWLIYSRRNFFLHSIYW